MLKKKIQFRRQNRVPAAVMGTKDDVLVPASTPVLVPADYADHLVADGFADHVEKLVRKARTRTAKKAQ